MRTTFCAIITSLGLTGLVTARGMAGGNEETAKKPSLAASAKEKPPIPAVLQPAADAYEAKRYEEAIRLATAVAGQAQKAGFAKLSVATTAWIMVGVGEEKLERRPPALTAYQKALALADKKNRPEEWAVAAFSVATMHHALGRAAEAEPIFRECLAVREKLSGPDDPKTAEVLNNLGYLLLATRRPAEAEPLLRRALAIWDKSPGGKQPAVALALTNLANCLQATGRRAEAEPLLRRALAINEAASPRDDLAVAGCLTNLASFLHSTGRGREAEPLYRRALALYEQSVGKNHPSVVGALNNFAIFHESNGRPAEAGSLYRRALQIMVTSGAASNPDLPPTRTLIGNFRATLIKMGDTPGQAQEKIDRILEPIRKK